MSELVLRAGLPEGATPSGRLARFRLWLDVWSERQALKRLDAVQLRDIGIDPIDAAREAGRAAWDLPASRVLPLDR